MTNTSMTDYLRGAIIALVSVAVSLALAGLWDRTAEPTAWDKHRACAARIDLQTAADPAARDAFIEGCWKDAH